MPSITEEYGLIVSTTGTLDSEYATLARKHLQHLEDNQYIALPYNETYLFEICDKSDPHIVEEKDGAWLIGVRSHKSGLLKTEKALDRDAVFLEVMRPKHTKYKFKDIPETKREGFMVRDAETEEVLCKIKSGFYLAKKAFMRMGRNRIDLVFDNPKEFKKQIDEEFYDFHEYLVDNYTKEDYYSLNEYERRQLIEEYFNEK